MSRNRKPPIAIDIPDLYMAAPDYIELQNGIPLYLIPGSTCGLIKMEVIFLAGRLHERHPLAARAACRLIREGVEGRSSADIAEMTDFYGGAISSSDSMDHNGLVLQCLSRFFYDLLPLLSDLILKPTFPEKEVASFIRNNQQRLVEDLSKNEIIAYRELTARIFGENHPYGYNSFPETYASLDREKIVEFWTDHYCAGNAIIILSGEVEPKMIEAIDQQLCAAMRPGVSSTIYPEPPPAERAVYHKQSRRTHQNALRIGRLFYNRSHPDYYPLHAVNMVLGGYFGSRLMTRIREELGLTYNIYTHIDAMRYASYFYISAEVSKKQAKRTLTEIYKVMEDMANQPPEETELLMMKRFACGNMLHLLDGPFPRADTLRNLLVEGGTYDDFNQMVDALKNIETDDIVRLTQKWLNPADMIEVVIG